MWGKGGLNKELKFFFENSKKNRGGGGSGRGREDPV